MRQTSHCAEEVKKQLATLDEEENLKIEPDTKAPAVEPLTTATEEQEELYDVYTIPGGVVILRVDENGQSEENIIDTTIADAVTEANSVPATETQIPGQKAQPPLKGKERVQHAILTVSFYSFLILSGLLLQSSLSFNSPTATVTLIPKSQQVTLTGTLQLGRLLNSLTLSQSQTVPTTGHGHQDARAATGSITFYNGQLNSVSVPAGTVLTASNGVQVITEQDALIPKASPPIEGQATIAAHTGTTGSLGNIPTKALNQTCCALSVLAVNLAPFHGGQDERNFQTVTKNDMNAVTATLQPAVEQSMQAALQGLLQQGEALQTLPCTPTVTADHHVGQEATTVRVTAFETCSAIAYEPQALETKAKALLSRQAAITLGTGYSLIGDVQTSITQAVVTHAIPILAFSCQGTWVYALSQEAQQQMKQHIAGKAKQEALTLLLSLPGIEQASIRWDEQTKLPESLNALHLVIIVPNS
jgi:hypothetical protein